MTGTQGTYMPGLDGLRAYLMFTVLLFHCKVPGFAGGWISVDVFFALSGVLITRNLMDELSTTGSVSIGRFWSRRTRRLLPALVTFLAVSAALVVAGAMALSPSAAWGAITYTTNWVHILVPGNGYWDAYSAPDPFEHLWSLAVEEQFYLVWPLLVLLLRRRGRRVIGAFALVLALASVVTQVVGVGAGWSIDRLYQGTDTRAVPFLLGAAAACIGVERFDRRVFRIAAIGGLAVLVWATHTLDGSLTSTYLGPLQVVSVAGVLVVLAVAHNTNVMLCHPAVRTLGWWSYGFYLFHWPLVVMLPAEWQWWARLPVVALGSTALAALTYRFVETPIRSGLLSGRRLVPAGLSIAMVAATVVVVAAPMDPSTQYARAETAVDWDQMAEGDSSATTAAPGVERGGAPSDQTAQARPATGGASGIGLDIPATPRRVLVLGDSTANVLAHGLESTGRFDIVDGGMWGCPLVEAVRVRPAIDSERSAEYCPGLQEQIAAIEMVDPDVVVAIASATEVWDHLFTADGDWSTPGDTAWHSAHDAHFAALVTAHPDTPIVLVPAPDWRPPSDDALETPERREAWNAQIERWVAAHDQALTMEYVRYLPAPGTPEDRDMRPDGAHLTDEWIERLSREYLADDLVEAYTTIRDRLASRT